MDTISLRRASEGTLAEVNPQEKPPRAPNLTSTFLDVDILRRVRGWEQERERERKRKVSEASN